MNHPLATVNKLMSPLAAGLELDQIAFAAHSDEDVENIKRLLRLEKANWIVDEATAKGQVPGTFYGVPAFGENVARLEFNYDFGIELEILRYLKGHNYLDAFGVTGLCHLGCHLRTGCQPPINLTGIQIVQQVQTTAHTSAYLQQTGRKYRYTIYDTRKVLGVFFKVIERIGGENRD